MHTAKHTPTAVNDKIRKFFIVLCLNLYQSIIFLIFPFQPTITVQVLSIQKSVNKKIKIVNIFKS